VGSGRFPFTGDAVKLKTSLACLALLAAPASASANRLTFRVPPGQTVTRETPERFSPTATVLTTVRVGGWLAMQEAGTRCVLFNYARGVVVRLEACDRDGGPIRVVAVNAGTLSRRVTLVYDRKGLAGSPSRKETPEP
jgi:FAD/FMN-containing dehydrogenase